MTGKAQLPRSITGTRDGEPVNYPVSISWARPPRLCVSNTTSQMAPIEDTCRNSPFPTHPLKSDLAASVPPHESGDTWDSCGQASMEKVPRAACTADSPQSPEPPGDKAVAGGHHAGRRPQPHGGTTRRGSGQVPAEVVCQQGPQHVGAKTPPSYPRPTVTSPSKAPGKKQRGRPRPPCHVCSRLSLQGWFGAVRVAGELRALITGTPGVKVFNFFPKSFRV